MKGSANDNWQLVKTIFDDARRQPVEVRRQFIRKASGGNRELAFEVESLLASLDSAEAFLEAPAVVHSIDDSLSGKVLLTKGRILGHYEIIEFIGSGGMGEVYLARDTRLNRNVAIKLMRPSFLPDAHAKSRLLREARAAALLEHPNICQIHEIAETSDHCFIVMQYVVGKTLAEILSKGPLDADLAIDLAIQIADGLAEAHEQSIIHRDIKPANIIANEKGQAKILDFGLAKFIETESSGDTLERLNSSGAVMGTVPYMSPEQLRGKVLDARTDIFSLGALLYEMLTGHAAFARDNNAEVIAAILNDEPDWSRISPKFKSTLRKSLAKNRTDRYANANLFSRDLKVLRNSSELDNSPQLHDTSRNKSAAVTDTSVTKKNVFHAWQSSSRKLSSGSKDLASTDLENAQYYRFKSVGIAVFAVILLILGTTAYFVWKASRTHDAPDFDSLRSVDLIAWKTGTSSNSDDFRVSHNGKLIAYSSSRKGGNDAIYIKQTSDGQEFQVTDNSRDNISPLWSPDDQKIAFVSTDQDQPGIYFSPTLGGAVAPILITEKGNMLLRHWSLDGSAIFYEQLGNLYRLDLGTHSVTKVTQLADSPGRSDREFAISPDEKHIAFCNIEDGQTDIWTMPIDGSELTRITNDAEKESRPMWHPDGQRIIYNVWRNDLVQIDQARVGDEPVQITRGKGDYALLDLSLDGERLYYASSQRRSDIYSVDLESLREVEVAAEPAGELWADVASDSRSVVYQSSSLPHPARNLSESSLWFKKSDGQTRQLAGKGFDPRWLPDNRHIAVFRLTDNIKGEYSAFIIDTVTGQERRLTDEDMISPSYSVLPITRLDVSVLDFASNSDRIVYLDSRQPNNVKVSTLNGGAFVSLTKNENPNVRYYSPRFARDGETVAFASVERPGDKTQKPIARIQTSNGQSTTDVFTTTENLRFIGWSAASEIILATTEDRLSATPLNVQILAATIKGASRRLATLEDVYPRTLTISSDGKTLAFTARRNGNDDIWVLELDHLSQPKKVTTNPDSSVFLTNLAFSPNGKVIYFDKQEETNTISFFENFE